MGTIRLVVQADDLGMCRSVNEGIEHAIVDGIVTQTSVMAPTPWFVEGENTSRQLIDFAYHRLQRRSPTGTRRPAHEDESSGVAKGVGEFGARALAETQLRELLWPGKRWKTDVDSSPDDR